MADLEALTFRLTYADTDPAGIVYYAAWFPWMERAQSEWFHRHGLRQDQLHERTGVATLVRHTACDYLAPAGLYDEIELRFHFESTGRTSFRSLHEMRRTNDGVVVARGTIVLVTVDPGHGQPVPVPATLVELFTETAAA